MQGATNPVGVVSPRANMALSAPAKQVLSKAVPQISTALPSLAIGPSEQAHHSLVTERPKGSALCLGLSLLLAAQLLAPQRNRPGLGEPLLISAQGANSPPGL